MSLSLRSATLVKVFWVINKKHALNPIMASDPQFKVIFGLKGKHNILM